MHALYGFLISLAQLREVGLGRLKEGDAVADVLNRCVIPGTARLAKAILQEGVRDIEDQEMARCLASAMQQSA